MNLRELGLSEYEEKAYTTLIKLGKTSASEISRNSQVSYGKIYEVLASLEQKGLIKTIPENTKKFIASDPENLMHLVNKKEEELLEIKNSIRELKQIYSEKEQEPVLVAKGKNNWHKLEKELKASEKYYYSIKYDFSFRPEFVRQTKQLISQKIDYRVIGRFDKETENNIKQWKKIITNIKPIENNGVTMSIIDDEELMIGLIKSNTSMLIKDKSFVQLMKTLFVDYYQKH
ncbi:TPA: TrmB family transcriptional regulator [Candidatus Woesearchaeota archaeon]|nr:hypothetical protein [uncultured archaeon]MBS3173025.1 TrmB family transcriptional regulator [Candidatus Woesearchaeota archaeon]AQS32934.1 hypothetical protein [uncultured archaeon]HIH31885.1 TrmB family transcriptional regulator [Candidatus Woesearchaeota archaeon]HIH54364.1 TrmB family transcriptional regulator [Candidatus Woesearchaeota archaeon]